MKNLLIFFGILCLTTPCIAQQPTEQAGDSTSEEYAYCEIIADHLPAYTPYRVLFDFGQKTQPWAYNWLTNSEGDTLEFGSGIEALNYMTGQGWEFVQAFSSGTDNKTTHYLLRMHRADLSAEQLQQLLTPPQIHKKSSKKKK